MKFPIKLTRNINNGCIMLVVVMQPVVNIKVVISGINKFIKLIISVIAAFVIFNIDKKVFIIKVTIIKYCTKYAILLEELFSSPSIIDLKMLCIIITTKTLIINDTASFISLFIILVIPGSIILASTFPL